MKVLKIYVDETGEFGFSTGSSELYGVSFVFIDEDNDDITNEMDKLNNKLRELGYTKMIHMADLIMKSGDYKHYDIKMRKSIFNALYQFARRISAKYYSVFINKKYLNNRLQLKTALSNEVDKMIKINYRYFSKYDDMIMYYDNGQELLGNILDIEFNRFKKFTHITNFNHINERLFQVADMLTFIDKYDYKYKHKIKLNLAEKYFFHDDDIRRILRELGNKRL